MWLDCDPGIDDALAIFMLAAQKNLKLIGVSATFGNTIIENTTRNSLGILKMSGLGNVPVF